MIQSIEDLKKLEVFRVLYGMLLYIANPIRKGQYQYGFILSKDKGQFSITYVEERTQMILKTFSDSHLADLILRVNDWYEKETNNKKEND